VSCAPSLTKWQRGKEVVLRLDGERVARRLRSRLSSCRRFYEVDILISSPFPIPNISVNRWKMPSREWENGLCQPKASMFEEGNSESTEETCTHSSGLFCASITTAIGIPKFDTRPQKSVSHQHRSASIALVRCQPPEAKPCLRTRGQVGESRGTWEGNVRVET